MVQGKNFRRVIFRFSLDKVFAERMFGFTLAFSYEGLVDKAPDIRGHLVAFKLTAEELSQLRDNAACHFHGAGSVYDTWESSDVNVSEYIRWVLFHPQLDL
mgnify:CR=1 FL=1